MDEAFDGLAKRLLAGQVPVAVIWILPVEILSLAEYGIEILQPIFQLFRIFISLPNTLDELLDFLDKFPGCIGNSNSAC